MIEGFVVVLLPRKFNDPKKVCGRPCCFCFLIGEFS